MSWVRSEWRPRGPPSLPQSPRMFLRSDVSPSRSKVNPGRGSPKTTGTPASSLRRLSVDTDPGWTWTPPLSSCPLYTTQTVPKLHGSGRVVSTRNRGTRGPVSPITVEVMTGREGRTDGQWVPIQGEEVHRGVRCREWYRVTSQVEHTDKDGVRPSRNSRPCL